VGNVQRESGDSPTSDPERRDEETGSERRDEEADPSGYPKVEHAGSDKDAMGQDKRREVVGHSYGPSKARQLIYYGLFVAFLVALYIGGKIAVDELDKAPANNPAKAPWSKGPQEAPKQFQ
jgi:hypothetical protein